MGKDGLSGVCLRENLLFRFFIIYFTIAVIGGLFSPRHEYFPVFSWSLFSHVAPISLGYEVEILRVNDMIYDPPVNFFTLKDSFRKARNRESSILKVAHAYHFAQLREPSRLAVLRSVIEGSYLGDVRRVDYQIVIVEYDPLQRWHTGEVIRKWNIATLSTEDSR
jgi:hypothetical protein